MVASTWSASCGIRPLGIELISLISAAPSELNENLPPTPPDRQGQQQTVGESQASQDTFQICEP